MTYQRQYWAQHQWWMNKINFGKVESFFNHFGGVLEVVRNWMGIGFNICTSLYTLFMVVEWLLKVYGWRLIILEHWQSWESYKLDIVN